MRELQQAAGALAGALGIAGDVQEIPQGFSIPDGWTTLAAQAGAWEIALIVSGSTLEALGGEEQGLGTLAEALESQGKQIADMLGVAIGEEASLAITGVIQAGAAVADGEMGVGIVVAGPALPDVAKSSGASSGAGTNSVVSGNAARADGTGMRILSDVEMTVTAELGRAFMTVRELLSLTPGSIVELDRVAGTPIDVLVNGTVVARGEVVVVDEEFGVRITEIVDDSNV
jgi:flagellar motor switch protein FliN/FliY